MAFPIVDLAPILSGKDPNNSELELFRALSVDGFAYLLGHGIPQEKVNQAFTQSRKFFGLTPEQKSIYSKSIKDVHFHGYATGIQLPTKLHELREMFDIWSPENKYPDDLISGFKPALLDLREELLGLGWKLLELLGRVLKFKDEQCLVRAHQAIKMTTPDLINDKTSLITFRTMKYPPIPADYSPTQGSIRCRKHSDYGTITLLLQDEVGGLEVRKRDGSWVEATPIPGSIMISTCDLLEVWSGGQIPACVHRVPIPEDEEKRKMGRQSISLFLYPDSDTLIYPQVKSPMKKYADFQPINSSHYFAQPWDYNFSSSFNKSPY